MSHFAHALRGIKCRGRRRSEGRTRVARVGPAGLCEASLAPPLKAKVFARAAWPDVIGSGLQSFIGLTAKQLLVTGMLASEEMLISEGLLPWVTEVAEVVSEVATTVEPEIATDVTLRQFHPRHQW